MNEDHRDSHRTAPRNPLAVPVFLLLAAVGGCAPSPEDLVRTAIREAKRAFESEDVQALRGFVSERYTDAAARTRGEVVDFVVAHAGHLRPVHVFTIERRLERLPSGGIEVELLVAVASTPIESLLDASRASADVAVVTLLFEEAPRSAWRVVRGDWRPATPADLLPL